MWTHRLHVQQLLQLCSSGARAGKVKKRHGERDVCAGGGNTKKGCCARPKVSWQGPKVSWQEPTVRILSTSTARCCTASLQNNCARGMHKLLPTNNDPNSRHPHMIDTHVHTATGHRACPCAICTRPFCRRRTLHTATAHDTCMTGSSRLLFVSMHPAPSLPARATCAHAIAPGAVQQDAQAPGYPRP